MIRDDRSRSPLPVLDNLYVAAPCKASWDDMVGDERSRFCGQCDKNVYNLSAMTRPEAEALLVEKEGRLCVRYYQRADGTVLTTDCPDGLRRRRRRNRVVAAAFGAMSAVAAASAIAPRARPTRPAPITTEVETAPEPYAIKMGEAPAQVQPVQPEVQGQVTGGVVAFREPMMGKMAPPERGHATTGKPHKKR